MTNVTHHSMIYVDEEDQRWTTKPHPEYPRRLIDLILNNIDDSDILDLINHDPEQVKLIAKDLLWGMLPTPQEAMSNE